MIKQYFKAVSKIANLLAEDRESLQELVYELRTLQKNQGRLFIIGVGGSAANASHAVNDFRKLCGIEAYAPTDNVAELTARINDDGWENALWGCLETSSPGTQDCILVFSVGGGNKEKKVSTNLIKALQEAKKHGVKILGIVGRDGGYTKKVADVCVVIPTVNEYLVTPFVESFQAIIWHMLVFHPDLNINQGKWESLKK